MHILKRKEYEFLAASLMPGRFPMKILGKWDQKGGGTEYPTWKLVLTTAPGAYGKKDLEEPFTLKDDAPEIVLYAAENFEGDQSSKGDKFVAKSIKGISYIKWSEFCKILIASGIDAKVQGDCQPLDTKVGIKPIYLDIYPKEAWGDYPARNVANDWDTKPDHFAAKRKASGDALLAGLAAVASGENKGGGINLDGAEGETVASKRRVVDLSDEEPANEEKPVGTAENDKKATNGAVKAGPKAPKADAAAKS